MAVDERLLDKAVVEPEKLTRREWAMLKLMRAMYSGERLAAVLG